MTDYPFTPPVLNPDDPIGDLVNVRALVTAAVRDADAHLTVLWQQREQLVAQLVKLDERASQAIDDQHRLRTWLEHNGGPVPATTVDTLRPAVLEYDDRGALAPPAGVLADNGED